MHNGKRCARLPMTLGVLAIAPGYHRRHRLAARHLPPVDGEKGASAAAPDVRPSPGQIAAVGSSLVARLCVGKITSKTEPWGRRGNAVRLPPWAWTIDRQIDSPIPIP